MPLPPDSAIARRAAALAAAMSALLLSPYTLPVAPAHRNASVPAPVPVPEPHAATPPQET